LTLSIADNGHGFDPSTIPASSYGITSMKQRVAEVNGTLAIESTHSVGTKIVAQVPQRFSYTSSLS
jgi:NarL family two-component system sensor histidine kinase LiaS